MPGPRKSKQCCARRRTGDALKDAGSIPATSTKPTNAPDLIEVRGVRRSRSADRLVIRLRDDDDQPAAAQSGADPRGPDLPERDALDHGYEPAVAGPGHNLAVDVGYGRRIQ